MLQLTLVFLTFIAPGQSSFFLEPGFNVKCWRLKGILKLVLKEGQRNDSLDTAPVGCSLPYDIAHAKLSVTSSNICEYALGKMEMYVNDTEVILAY
jgi:hypothetical protein